MLCERAYQYIWSMLPSINPKLVHSSNPSTTGYIGFVFGEHLGLDIPTSLHKAAIFGEHVFDFFCSQLIYFCHIRREPKFFFCETNIDETQPSRMSTFFFFQRRKNFLPSLSAFHSLPSSTNGIMSLKSCKYMCVVLFFVSI